MPPLLPRSSIEMRRPAGAKGLDALDAYFARYLPRLVLAVAIPLAVLVRVAFADWISAVIITITLIPVFAVLIGWHTRAQTRRQWHLLGRLGGHFLDVVAGLPTLKLFGRATAQAAVIKQVTGTHRTATMATLRVAFLSALALELTAALVAVEIGLRLLAGHLDYQSALLIALCCGSSGSPGPGYIDGRGRGAGAQRRPWSLPLPRAPSVPRPGIR